MKIRFDKAGLFRTSVVVAGWGALLYWVLALSTRQALPAILFALFAGLVEYVDIALPEGSSTSAVSAIGIAAILVFPLPLAVVSMVAGVSVARLLKERRVQIAEALYFAGETGLVVSFAGLFMGGATFVRLGGTVPPLASAGTLRVVGVCAAYFISEVALRQLAFGLEQSGRFLPLFLGAAKFLGPIYAALASIGVLMALMYPSMGVWSAALFMVLLLITRQSFSLYLDVRKTYRSTIAALATAIEAEAPERHGHGERVASLSIKMARELGVHGQQLEWVGYAGLLHDIGRLGVDEDSFDGLLENLNARTGEVQHAIAGADILDRVQFLKAASDLVRFHHTPHSMEQRSRTRSGRCPLGSRIINVASCYDELTTPAESEDRLRPREALARIKKEQGLSFDPKVVRALGQVLGKSSDGR